MPEVLVDTTVLNNFAQILRPDLLQLAFSDLRTTGQVREELDEGERLGIVPRCDWSCLEILPLAPEERALADELGRRVDAGEAECLALAKLRGWLFLTDDRTARKVAQGLGVKISGTLGSLERLVSRTILSLDEADRLLEAMTSRGYRSPIRSLRERR
jgi:predicted nucleic acid-binding protein